LAVTLAGAVTTGCVGAATIVQVAVPAGLLTARASVTTQEGTALPLAPAVKVMVVPVVPEVIVPPVIVQA
jgi:hypothetical protein